MSNVTNKILLKQITDSLELSIKETEFEVERMKRQLRVLSVFLELPDEELNNLLDGIRNWSK